MNTHTHTHSKFVLHKIVILFLVCRDICYRCWIKGHISKSEITSISNNYPRTQHFTCTLFTNLITLWQQTEFMQFGRHAALRLYFLIWFINHAYMCTHTHTEFCLYRGWFKYTGRVLSTCLKYSKFIYNKTYLIGE